ALDLERAGDHRGVDLELDLDRAEERVALVASVLASGVAQLAQQRVVDLGEVLVVLRAQVDGEVVRHHRAPADVDGAVVVHLPHEPAAELDGAQAAAEGACEDTLHHSLESPFESGQAHGRPLYAGLVTWPTVTRASGGIGRRAGFRFLCPQGRGGSSPPSPTRFSQVTAYARCADLADFYRTSTGRR